MRRLSTLAGALALGLTTLLAAGSAAAQAVLFIDNARVHTAGPQGTLANGDVIVTDGVITAVGAALTAPAGATRIDAKGQPLTPGLFAGLTALGLEEISAESSTVHSNLGAPVPHVHPGETRWRPEFDVLPVYNPRSQVIGVNRIEGLTFTVLAPARSRKAASSPDRAARCASTAASTRCSRAAAACSSTSAAAPWRCLAAAAPASTCCSTRPSVNHGPRPQR